MDVVFDIGNVLLRWDPRFLFRKIFEDECRMEHFLSTACANDWILETDTCADFAAAVAARANRHPEYAAELRMFDERWLETLEELSNRTSPCSGVFARQAAPFTGLPITPRRNSICRASFIRSWTNLTRSLSPAGRVSRNPTRAYSESCSNGSVAIRTSCCSSMILRATWPPARNWAWQRYSIVQASISNRNWNATAYGDKVQVKLRSESHAAMLNRRIFVNR